MDTVTENVKVRELDSLCIADPTRNDKRLEFRLTFATNL